LDLGSRTHPDTGVLATYWLCDYVSGTIMNKDPKELDEVKWLTGEEALSKITSDVYSPLKSLLLNSIK